MSASQTGSQFAFESSALERSMLTNSQIGQNPDEPNMSIAIKIAPLFKQMQRNGYVLQVQTATHLKYICYDPDKAARCHFQISVHHQDRPNERVQIVIDANKTVEALCKDIELALAIQEAKNQKLIDDDSHYVLGSFCTEREIAVQLGHGINMLTVPAEESFYDSERHLLNVTKINSFIKRFFPCYTPSQSVFESFVPRVTFENGFFYVNSYTERNRPDNHPFTVQRLTTNAMPMPTGPTIQAPITMYPHTIHPFAMQRPARFGPMPMPTGPTDRHITSPDVAQQSMAPLAAFQAPNASSAQQAAASSNNEEDRKLVKLFKSIEQLPFCRSALKSFDNKAIFFELIVQNKVYSYEFFLDNYDNIDDLGRTIEVDIACILALRNTTLKYLATSDNGSHILAQKKDDTCSTCKLETGYEFESHRLLLSEIQRRAGVLRTYTSVESKYQYKNHRIVEAARPGNQITRATGRSAPQTQERSHLSTSISHNGQGRAGKRRAARNSANNLSFQSLIDPRLHRDFSGMDSCVDSLISPNFTLPETGMMTPNSGDSGMEFGSMSEFSSSRASATGSFDDILEGNEVTPNSGDSGFEFGSMSEFSSSRASASGSLDDILEEIEYSTQGIEGMPALVEDADEFESLNNFELDQFEHTTSDSPGERELNRFIVNDLGMNPNELPFSSFEY